MLKVVADGFVKLLQMMVLIELFSLPNYLLR